MLAMRDFFKSIDVLQLYCGSKMQESEVVLSDSQWRGIKKLFEFLCMSGSFERVFETLDSMDQVVQMMVLLCDIY